MGGFARYSLSEDIPLIRRAIPRTSFRMEKKRFSAALTPAMRSLYMEHRKEDGEHIVFTSVDNHANEPWLCEPCSRTKRDCIATRNRM